MNITPEDGKKLDSWYNKLRKPFVAADQKATALRKQKNAENVLADETKYACELIETIRSLDGTSIEGTNFHLESCVEVIPNKYDPKDGGGAYYGMIYIVPNGMTMESKTSRGYGAKGPDVGRVDYYWNVTKTYTYRTFQVSRGQSWINAAKKKTPENLMPFKVKFQVVVTMEGEVMAKDPVAAKSAVMAGDFLTPPKELSRKRHKRTEWTTESSQWDAYQKIVKGDG